MPNRKAIVTMAVGDRHVESFERLCRTNWTAYAEAHGYDLYVLTEPIDRTVDLSRKSIHWQKLLVGLIEPLKGYDHVVWVDGDILINPHTAPCIVSTMTSERIGIVGLTGDMVPRDPGTGDRLRLLFRKLAVDAGGSLDREPVAAGGDPGRRLINTGVFVFQPRRHNDFLAQVYVRHEADDPDGSLEQTPFALALTGADLAEFLDPRFNMPWSIYAARHYPFLFDRGYMTADWDVYVKCVNTFYHNNFFSHFPGHGRNPIVKTIIEHVDQDARHLVEALFPEAWARRDSFFPDPDEG